MPIILPFPECHVKGIIQYVACIWLLSLNKICACCGRYLTNSLLFIANIVCCLDVPYLLIHSLLNGHWLLLPFGNYK